MKKTITVAALAVLSVSFSPSAARAQSALLQLGAEAGVDAAPLAQGFRAARALAAQPPLTIPLDAKDVFEGCPALDVKSILPISPKMGALLVQTCLNHAYPQDGAFRVTAEAARFGLRSCPMSGDTKTCGAMMEVLGIKITVSGSIMTGNPVLSDLHFSLAQRGGKLLGLYADLDDEAQLLP